MVDFLSFNDITDDCDFERIDRLQSEMNKRAASICCERAEILTASYQGTEGEPIVIRRAKAFEKVLSNMSIYIQKDSLIFGNQASVNFAAPIFPEYSFNWVIEELAQFEKRRGDSFVLSSETAERLKKLQPYWQGITHQDEVLRNLPEINFQAEKQGVLHRGGISMSGDGHIIPNHELVLSEGYGGIARIAEEKLTQADITQEQKDFYTAVVIAMRAALSYIKRFGICALEMADIETDPKRKKELEQIGDMAATLMEGKAGSFYEAVQSVYLTHLLMMIESNGHSFSFGRFDQYTYPYYQADMESGKLTKAKALELIIHFFLMTNSLNKVRPWGHSQFSAGYPLYSNLMVGGMKPDGSDGTNDLSYLCLEAMNQSRLPEPNLSVRFSKETPRELIRDAAKLIRKGYGMPAVFCDEVVISAMQTLDLDLETARDYSSMGCVEVAIPGKWGHRATGMTYINFAKILEIILNNGVDPKTGIQLFNITGQAGREVEYANYEELWAAWNKALKFYFELAVACDLVCDRALKYHDADPFASSTVDCCLDRGKTLKNGGAKYDYISQSNTGLSVVGDSLAAVKKLVFDEGKLKLKQLMEALEADFEGLENQRVRKLCLGAPKFGNDDDYADKIIAAVYESYLDLLPGYRNDRHGRGPIGCGYTMSTSNITSYVPNGLNVGATPDGRLAGKPLNEGASPCQGVDKQGPTAVINSMSKLPNRRIAGGQLLNMRFSPGALEGDDNLEKFMDFILCADEMNIFHNQFNIVDGETLRAAKERPEEYGNLMVRVAGYCALFTTLTPQAQDAIIARTEHIW